jgi:DNA anti-recombination protein RmuC
LPANAFEFQATLSNRTRPDCLVRLPGDERGLVIDAKFPLEGFPFSERPRAMKPAAGRRPRSAATCSFM